MEQVTIDPTDLYHCLGNVAGKEGCPPQYSQIHDFAVLFAHEYTAKLDATHDMGHILYVYNTTLFILAQERVERQIVEPAMTQLSGLLNIQRRRRSRGP